MRALPSDNAPSSTNPLKIQAPAMSGDAVVPFPRLVSGRSGLGVGVPFVGVGAVVVPGAPGALGAVVVPGAPGALGASVGAGDGVGLDEGRGLGASTTLVMLAEQITNDPPPLAESLHWLIVTPWAAA